MHAVYTREEVDFSPFTCNLGWVPQDPEPGKDYIYVHLMFFVASIGLAVLLMNIFIAVLGQNLELFQDQAAQLSLGHCSKGFLALSVRFREPTKMQRG